MDRSKSKRQNRDLEGDESHSLLVPEPVTDEQWQAVIGNDSAYDGQFFYAVKTTGIFCRPSCKSRAPKREHIGFFITADDALQAKFRPCKRCKPTGERLPDEEWIKVVTDYVDRNYSEALTLNKLALICHGTPYHLHRTFKKVTGITPVAYIQQVRIVHAQNMLIDSDKSIAEIGQSVGMANTPYFITLFKKKTGLTPKHYREQLRPVMEGEH